MITNIHLSILCIFFKINIYFQEAFSQSDFQKGHEQIYKAYTRESSKIGKKVYPKYRNTTRDLSVQSKLFQCVMAW
jgi:hypothetical protein